jgi:hypothetical protein
VPAAVSKPECHRRDHAPLAACSERASSQVVGRLVVWSAYSKFPSLGRDLPAKHLIHGQPRCPDLHLFPLQVLGCETGGFQKTTGQCTVVLSYTKAIDTKIIEGMQFLDDI